MPRLSEDDEVEVVGEEAVDDGDVLLKYGEGVPSRTTKSVWRSKRRRLL